MTRFASLLVVGVFLMAAILFTPQLAVGKEDGSGLAVGKYSGACQLMIIGRDGVVSYDDTPLGICHVEITADEILKADFPDKKLGRGRWDNVTLRLSSKEPRAVWTAVIQNDIYKATAIPYSPKAYVFRLEITNNGKLIAGAQQFYAIEGKKEQGKKVAV